MDQFDSTQTNQGILKDWYSVKTTSDALKKRRETMAKNRGIEDQSEKPVEAGGADK